MNCYYCGVSDTDLEENTYDGVVSCVDVDVCLERMLNDMCMDQLYEEVLSNVG